MPDYLVSVISGAWSVAVRVDNQPDPATAGQAVLTNLGQKIKNLMLGDVLEIQPTPDFLAGGSQDYLVPVSVGGWSALVYVDGQPDMTMAANVGLAQMGQKVTRLVFGVPVVFDAQLVRVA